MIDKIFEKSCELLSTQHFDCLAVGVIDFDKHTFECFELLPPCQKSDIPKAYFDLASVTKVLTLASTHVMHPEYFNDDSRLTLNHKAGLPSWGRLSKENWREQILSYPIIESPTLYSDYSALRTMLEIEKKTGKSLKDICSVFWDSELCFWTDLPDDAYCPPTGFRDGELKQGEVDNDNAYVIGEFCSHAGAFGTVTGVAKSLIALDKEFGLLKSMKKEFETSTNGPYISGWNRPLEVDTTLAGDKCGDKCFGHLGFTGTSIWVNIEQKRGSIVLSNGTKNYWYDKSGLNNLRKTINNMIWEL